MKEEVKQFINWQSKRPCGATAETFGEYWDTNKVSRKSGSVVDDAEETVERYTQFGFNKPWVFDMDTIVEETVVEVPVAPDEQVQ